MFPTVLVHQTHSLKSLPHDGEFMIYIIRIAISHKSTTCGGCHTVAMKLWKLLRVSPNHMKQHRKRSFEFYFHNNNNSSDMMAQWENKCISLSPPSSLSSLWPAWVQLPTVAGYFKGFLPGWSHSVNPSWASVAKNGSISPQWHHTTCGQRGGRPEIQPLTDDGW